MVLLLFWLIALFNMALESFASVGNHRWRDISKHAFFDVILSHFRHIERLVKNKNSVIYSYVVKTCYLALLWIYLEYTVYKNIRGTVNRGLSSFVIHEIADKQMNVTDSNGWVIETTLFCKYCLCCSL